MKKRSILSIVFAIMFVLIALFVIGFIVWFINFNANFVSPQEEVFQSIGEYECVEYYSSNTIQDFTDFGVFYYSKPEIENAENFSEISDEKELFEYIDNFEGWVKGYPDDYEIKQYYNFDRAIIDKKDYIYIADKSSEDDTYPKFHSYDLYFFDLQSQKLYYFHNNL